MATIDRTPNGGTAGHPANVARPYVVTSQVHDTADGGTGGDVGSVCAAGFTPFLEAAVGASGSNARMLTSADTIDALILDGGSTGESALRFRVHVVLADVSKNPVESATVSTGT